MLPQGKAYQALYKRLSHMNMIYKLDYDLGEKGINQELIKKGEDIEYLLKTFDKMHFRKKLRHISSEINMKRGENSNSEEDDENMDNYNNDSLYEENNEIK